MPSQEAEIEVLKSKIDTYIETIKGLEIQAFEIEKGIKINSKAILMQAPSVWEEKNSQVPFLTKTGRAIASLWQTANGRLKLFYLSSYLISFTVLATRVNQHFMSLVPGQVNNIWC
ncbi:hypothetical protein [Nostoc sp. CCY0012]|uniref:hypothetical protein n=1 Tax=Nostoc sp. CCY0012 TaxID=1056123 RepID=UPI0039C72B8F